MIWPLIGSLKVGSDQLRFQRRLESPPLSPHSVVIPAKAGTS